MPAPKATGPARASTAIVAEAVEAVMREPASLIILDGAYSAGPEVSDLIDLSVLVDVPNEERHKPIGQREDDKAFLAAWHARWDAAEGYYFTYVRPASSFDLVVAIST